MALPPQGLALVIVSVVFPALAFIILMLRVYARRRTVRQLDASDYFLFFSMFILLCNSATCIAGAVTDGIGRPLAYLSLREQTGFMKVLFATQFFYIFSVVSVKIALLQFYKSIFIGQTFRKLANYVLVVLCAWTVACFWVTLFQDKPISRNWGTIGTTINFPILYIVENLTNIILDLFILCMPLAVIRTLQISRRKKWMLAGIFWLGALCVICSIVRLGYFVILNGEYRSRDNDFSSTAVHTVIWGEIEPCTSVMAACLPSLAPLLPGRAGRTRQASSGRTWGSTIRKQTSVNVVNQPLASAGWFPRESMTDRYRSTVVINGKRFSDSENGLRYSESWPSYSSGPLLSPAYEYRR